MPETPIPGSKSDQPLSPVTRWLGRVSPGVVTLYASFAAFAAYASMYAFRKPFTATDYGDVPELVLFGVAFGYKPIAIISQLMGYLLSKFLGIRFASSAQYRQRAPFVLALILFAEAMLVLYGLTPAPANLWFLFLNGLPLGMVWSMLFGLLEGRRSTEFLSLGMSISVIFSSGWVKSVGRLTMDRWQVSEFWMPAVTGVMFIPLLLLSLFMLRQLPPPTPEDIAERSARRPMSRADRKRFVRDYLPGVVCLVFGYLCLMSYRNVRDDFMDGILQELGHTVVAEDFANIESLVGLSVIAVLCCLRLVKNNRQAVWVNLGLIGGGALVLGASTVMLQGGLLSPRGFYILNGIGLYVAFVPYQSILMDRLVATLPTVATASFLIAIGDSYGYLSVVGIYLGRDIYQTTTGIALPWAELLVSLSYAVTILVPLAMVGNYAYFRRKMKSDAGGSA
jgi:hypothetical protein